MKITGLLFHISFLTVTATVQAGVVRTSTCQESSGNAPYLRGNDFSWDISLEALKERAGELYLSEKRLRNRAYVNAEGEVVMPINVPGEGQRPVHLTNTLIQSVRLHIEEGLKRKYVDEVMFSDMGHSHFFIPMKFYREELSSIPVEKKDELYEKMLAHPELKILYHTAEQLKMFDENRKLLDDRHLRWRFFTRNLVGDNKALGKMELLHNEDHSYNSANHYDENHKYLGAGFDLSANVNGCFPFEFKGKTYYFDLNFEGVHVN